MRPLLHSAINFYLILSISGIGDTIIHPGCLQEDATEERKAAELSHDSLNCFFSVFG